MSVEFNVPYLRHTTRNGRIMIASERTGDPKEEATQQMGGNERSGLTGEVVADAIETDVSEGYASAGEREMKTERFFPMI